MADARVTLAPGIDSLSALGASEPEALLGGVALLDEARMEQLEEGPGWTLFRLPLPGTPLDDGGPLTSSPRGSGTGWVRLLRFDGAPKRRLWSARFTHPRSASLAERRWNLVCVLRGAGVVTPEPLAVVAEGSAVASSRSALVWREADEGVPVMQALRTRRGKDRALVLDALGRFLLHLSVSEVEPFQLDPLRLRVLGEGGTQPESANDACALEQVLAARTGPRPAPVDGMRWREMPEILLPDILDGRIRSGHSVAQLETWIGQWSSLAAAGELSRVDRLRILRGARRDDWRSRARG
jgi:hypothetical protein